MKPTASKEMVTLGKEREIERWRYNASNLTSIAMKG